MSDDVLECERMAPLPHSFEVIEVHDGVDGPLAIFCKFCGKQWKVIYE